MTCCMTVTSQCTRSDSRKNLENSASHGPLMARDAQMHHVSGSPAAIGFLLRGTQADWSMGGGFGARVAHCMAPA